MVQCILIKNGNTYSNSPPFAARATGTTKIKENRELHFEDMNAATPIRRALVDLPINTSSAPRSIGKMSQQRAGEKRPYSAIDQSENLLHPLRVSLPPSVANGPRLDLESKVRPVKTVNGGRC